MDGTNEPETRSLVPSVSFQPKKTGKELKISIFFQFFGSKAVTMGKPTENETDGTNEPVSALPACHLRAGSGAGSGTKRRLHFLPRTATATTKLKMLFVTGFAPLRALQVFPDVPNISDYYHCYKDLA